MLPERETPTTKPPVAARACLPKSGGDPRSVHQPDLEDVNGSCPKALPPVNWPGVAFSHRRAGCGVFSHRRAGHGWILRTLLVAIQPQEGWIA